MALAEQTKYSPAAIPTHFLCAIAALPGVSILKGTSVSKDQVILSIPVWLLLPWRESHPACIQTHLPLGTSRCEPLHHLGQTAGIFKFKIQDPEEKGRFLFQAHLHSEHLYSPAFPKDLDSAVSLLWGFLENPVFLLGPLRVFSLLPTPLLPDPEYQQIKLF